MFGTQHLGLFIVSGLLLNLTPGQDTLYIVGRSVSQGRRAGLLSVMGITAGTLVHTLAAAFGLSAIFATSAQAFLVVKLIGGAYLVYLGVRMLLEPPGAAGQVKTFAADDAWAVFRSALLTNVLNPKVALFFLAFLPQFVSPQAESRVVAFLVLGGIFVVNGTLWCLVLVWAASAMSRRLRERSTAGPWLRRVSGAMFVGLGAKLAASR